MGLSQQVRMECRHVVWTLPLPVGDSRGHARNKCLQHSGISPSIHRHSNPHPRRSYPPRAQYTVKRDKIQAYCHIRGANLGYHKTTGYLYRVGRDRYPTQVTSKWTEKSAPPFSEGGKLQQPQKSQQPPRVTEHNNPPKTVLILSNYRQA